MHSSLRGLALTLGLLVGAAAVSGGCYYGYAAPGVGVYGGGPVYGGYYHHHHHGYWGGGPYYHRGWYRY